MLYYSIFCISHYTLCVRYIKIERKKGKQDSERQRNTDIALKCKSECYHNWSVINYKEHSVIFGETSSGLLKIMTLQRYGP